MIPKRIQLKRTRGWKMPANTVVVSRPSVFGNPWSLKETVATALFEPGTEAQVILDCYRTWLGDHGLKADKFPLYEKLAEQRAEVLRRLPELRGKNLACWCPIGAACHGDVLLELANE